MLKEAVLAAEGTPPLLCLVLFLAPHLGTRPSPKAGPRPGEQCSRVSLGGGEVGGGCGGTDAGREGGRDPGRDSIPGILQELGSFPEPLGRWGAGMLGGQSGEGTLILAPPELWARVFNGSRGGLGGIRGTSWG